LGERFWQLFELVGRRDLVEIGILTLIIYAILRFLSKTRGSAMVRGLGLILVGLILGAQVIIAAFDLAELGKILDYLLATMLVGLIVIFQPELRRGLILLGRYQVVRYLVRDSHPVVDKLADAAHILSGQCVGALIAIQREVALTPYAETGERIDAEISSALICTMFSPRSPLHDGAVILSGGRIMAAGCQLPLGLAEGVHPPIGMRHRAAKCLSEETDALLLVVSEETGCISIAVSGRLEAVARENLSRRLAELLSNESKLSAAA
jgi:diadenylate cyclase